MFHMMRTSTAALFLSVGIGAATAAHAGNPLNPAAIKVRPAPTLDSRSVVAVRPVNFCANAAKDFSSAGRAANASCRADDKWTELRTRLGAFEPSRDAANFDMRRDGAAWFAQYKNGRIYIADGADTPVAVFGEVYRAYLGAGGGGGVLGLPREDVADNPADSVKGLAGRFANGRIYWWEDLSPIVIPGQHDVYGAIARRYAELGGPSGKLGAPTSSEMPYGDNSGRFNRFEKGKIFWWPDTGAFESGPISIVFKGFWCFAESDNDGQSGSDEPYFIFATYAAHDSQALASATRTKIFEGVDAGHTEAASHVVYSGPADRLVLGMSAFEHDTGDPEEYKTAIGGAAQAAGTAVGSAFGGPVGGAALGAAAKAIGEAVSDALDTGDDIVDHKEFILSERDILRMSRAPMRDVHGIQHNYESEVLQSEGEGTYKLYFEIRPELQSGN